MAKVLGWKKQRERQKATLLQQEALKEPSLSLSPEATAEP
jgi:hypothetical protein